MAIAVIQDFPGGTTGQYDEISEKMGLAANELPEGAVSHWVAETDEGMRVVDVWESPAAFDTFAKERLGPAAAQVEGVPEPAVTILELYNVRTG
jgi:hypothetical protein